MQFYLEICSYFQCNIRNQNAFSGTCCNHSASKCVHLMAVIWNRNLNYFVLICCVQPKYFPLEQYEVWNRTNYVQMYVPHLWVVGFHVFSVQVFWLKAVPTSVCSVTWWHCAYILISGEACLLWAGTFLPVSSLFNVVFSCVPSAIFSPHLCLVLLSIVFPVFYPRCVLCCFWLAMSDDRFPPVPAGKKGKTLPFETSVK